MQPKTPARAKCVYCGEPATQVDHIVPVSKGGTDDVSNLVPACRSCNSSKGNRDVDEWRSTIAANGGYKTQNRERKITFVVELYPSERQMLDMLANDEHIRRSEVIRHLIRQAAIAAGIWPPEPPAIQEHSDAEAL